jgi:predicted SprT family Zn-dependent metalloprotease
MKFKFDSTLTKVDRDIFLQETEVILARYPELKKQDILVEWSGRLTASAGKVIYNRLVKNFVIRLSKNYLKKFGVDRNLKTFRHEVAHILDYLVTGKMGHGHVFKRYCTDLGGSMNSKMAGGSHSECASNEYIVSFKYEYHCPCGEVIQTRGKFRKVHNKGCRKCRTLVADMKLKTL